MNIVVLKGRAGSDSELKTSGKTNYVRFRLATSRKYKEEWLTDWHSCVVFGKSAQSIKKGDTVMVQGSYVNNTYTTSEGEERKEMVVNSIEMMVVPKLAPTHPMENDQDGFGY